jgi:GH25 family lysozyme M1 (1,4-beta-N-acetylmuramidase)
MHHHFVNRRTAVRVVAALGLAAGLATPIALGSLTPAAASKTYVGPDVADYQHPKGHSINWNKVAKDGKDFAIVKATEGTTYTNPYFSSDYAESLAAGLVHGSYHFARPAHPIAATAQAQASYFADAVGAVTTTHTLPPALDLEVTGGLSPKALTVWSQDFLLDLRALTNRTPMLYVSPYFWEHDVGDPAAFVRFPLWMAEYGVKTAPVSDLWQYTSTAHVSGIQGDVDLSKFIGTNGFPWSTLSNGTVATPWQAAAPAAPPSVHASPSGAGVKVSWRAPDAGTSTVSGYKVVASPGGQTVKTGPSTLSAKFNGLSTAHAYTFTVTATNAVGSGLASKASNAVTPRIPTKIKTTLPASVTYGDPLTVQAKLIQKGGTKAPLPGEQVLVYRRYGTSGPWKQVGKVVTDSNGMATVTLHPKRSEHLETVFPGAPGLERADRFDYFEVRPAVGASLSSAQTSVGGKVTLSGLVTPAVDHQKVKLEVHSGGWKLLDTSKTNKHGHYSFMVKPTAAGTISYRVAAVATSKRAAGHSPTVRLTVG